MNRLLDEKALAITLAGFALFYVMEHSLLHMGLTAIGVSFLVLFVAIMLATFRVAHHAEILAHKYGEPYGTLILTGSAVSVEVLMLIILMHNGSSPTLVRDTIYSALMLDINGILGLAAIIGGLKHGEQKYNVDSSNSYISMILVAVGIGMVLPDFISAGNIKAFSMFNIVVMLLMYAVFMRMQTVNHRYFFEYPYRRQISQATEQESDHSVSGAWHGTLLFLYVAAIGALAELLSVFLNAGIEATGLPLALAAVSVALISASPEILTALRASQENRMQTVVNIALGASLATVLMTIPLVEAIALFSGIDIVMGLTPLQGGMILLTMMVAMINFNDGETNALEGLVHLVMFLAFVALLFLA
jgi:Ca2+:H+ antiporter